MFTGDFLLTHNGLSDPITALSVCTARQDLTSSSPFQFFSKQDWQNTKTKRLNCGRRQTGSHAAAVSAKPGLMPAMQVTLPLDLSQKHGLKSISLKNADRQVRGNVAHLWYCLPFLIYLPAPNKKKHTFSPDHLCGCRHPDIIVLGG